MLWGPDGNRQMNETYQPPLLCDLKQVNFSVHQTPDLENGDNDSAFLTELLRGLNQVT